MILDLQWNDARRLATQQFVSYIKKPSHMESPTPVNLGRSNGMLTQMFSRTSNLAFSANFNNNLG